MDTADKDGLCDVCWCVVKAPTKFTLTVVDSEGNPIPGVQVKLYTGSADKTNETDENGAVSAEFVYYTYVRALVLNAPSGYESFVGSLYTFDGEEMTIVIE